ncbi:helix-turn-helix domain-containing protein [Deinococcus aquiradiocola]|uniref:HTH cro/C1-type domain-containing protein n=1 Tax=Deinococcus aquiradiocola TaxID=393059 RepID=A0A917PS63_9DEIO|nr:helix-turn-helix transcriptional regulator [Deinococcus aquiradiocola]GGJ89972.1 hypothetical protein GCM10008939_37410 [Deinococcus aquiradiocola]
MAFDHPATDPRVLGERLRAYIRASGKTQAKVAEEIGADPTYISQMVNGRVNWIKSDYFPALVKILSIKEEDVRRLNPAAIIEVSQPAAKTSRERSDVTIAASLLEAAELYGQRFPDLRDQAWQNYLHSFRPHGAIADTPEEWLDLYRDLIKHGITPSRN